MKRGKGEEKLMEPMFPRLHVNDTEKGGPRAPPRNKMALYEQLSIPSKGFKHGENANCQGNGCERDVFFSVQLPPSRHPAEKQHSCSSNSKTPLLPVESNKKTEKDDFRVPVYIKSKVGQGNGKSYSTLDGGKLSASTAVLSGRSRKDLNEQNSKQLAVSREHSYNSTSIPSMDKLDDVLKKADVRLQYEPRDDPDYTSGIFCKTDLLRPECRVDSQVGDTMLSEPVRVVGNGYSSLLVKDVASKEHILPNNNHSNDMESKDDKASESLQTRIADQGDDLSETSMVESASGIYVSPDDVVGIIGQKHFWKARRAIANQQRVFAIQVFELHRLIKVQRLIAGSSMLEDIAYLGKPVKDSSAKRLPLEYHNVSKQRKDSEKSNTRMECSAENTVDKSVKDLSAKRLLPEFIIRDGHNVSKLKKNSEKPNASMGCSAENTVGKTSFSSVQNNSQPSSYSLFSGHPITNDSTMGPWRFNQHSGHQWLIPVMTPSEGLVYKPYIGPGVTSSVCGGYEPPGLTPIIGNHSTPYYGIPTSHYQYQGVIMPFAPLAGDTYFPSYETPVINQAISSSTADQSNQFVAQGLQGQSSGKGANFYVQHQNSSNVPGNKNGTVQDVKSRSSRVVEMQASTASSPSGTSNRTVVDNAMEGRNVLPLFPTSPTTDNLDSSSQRHVPSHPARVIKVVPRNARSATESVARIFQSIQEERKQYDFDVNHL
ncbi:early flowering [Datura stramonium]|uniref:Early flowering n=1 Tax=Datura stramonium TaxID=4076 RepID=A0ABS8RM55_DATST|nr:early flowering [Datura stramonium]